MAGVAISPICRYGQFVFWETPYAVFTNKSAATEYYGRKKT